MQPGRKRVFFGAEVDAPWPAKLPAGRLLAASQRHMTLAFLGDVPYAPLQQLLDFLPKPSFCVGPCGYFDACLLLPPSQPNVVAWQARWLDDVPALADYQSLLCHWLRQHAYTVDARAWLPHVTLCRRPFDGPAWQKAHAPLPFCTTALHLYESLGNLTYAPLWSMPFKRPFVELEHTADIAFMVNAQNINQLYTHAFSALAFKCPALLAFYEAEGRLDTLDEVIGRLNAIITQADSHIGCALKAVSYHGAAAENTADKTMQWEMIVDV